MYVTVDSCNYKLEKDDLCVSELFEMLDSVKVEIGILDWGIKMTTLEDGMDVLYTLYAIQSTVIVTPPPPTHTLLCTLYLPLPSASLYLSLAPSLSPSLSLLPSPRPLSPQCF